VLGLVGGYSATALNLRSTDRRSDLLVIVVVLVVETVVEFPAIAPHTIADTPFMVRVFGI
jgi:hypothetical protein